MTDQARVAVYQHDACARHDTGWRHPEHQGRLRAVSRGIESRLPELLPKVRSARGEPMTEEEALTVHEPSLVRAIRDAVEEAARSESPVKLSADTVVSGASWQAALAASGCAGDAAEAVLGGDVRAAFCATRPPGHHATPTRAMGFCLLNHVALAARRVLSNGAARRVLIVDWDVHHGNGTQEIFYGDPDVFYLSMHQSPHYPGTGTEDERGEGPGEGTTLNLPLPPGLPRSRYRTELMEGVDEALGGFEPDLTFVSCGFDAAAGDPLGGFTLEPEDYRTLTVELIRRLERAPGAGVVSVMEGGYATGRLGDLAAAHLLGLVEGTEGG